MNKFFNRFLSILLIVLITILVLNQLYVVDFSIDARNVFIFLTLAIILLTSFKEILIGKSGGLKFLSIVTLICTIIGGIFSVINKQINFLIYICVLFSVLHGFLDLIQNKT